MIDDRVSCTHGQLSRHLLLNRFKCVTIQHMDKDIKHKRRKLAWEQLNTPRVSWETFKRIADGSSSLSQAQTVARQVMLKQLRKTSK